MTEQEIRRAVWTAEWQCYGKDRGDADYWVGKWPELEARGIEIKHPDYAIQRVMGMGAGGADVPLYGPYAHPPRDFFAPVALLPPYPGDVTSTPASQPASGAAEFDFLTARLDALESGLHDIAAKLDTLGKALDGDYGNLLYAISHAPRPNYSGKLFGLAVVLRPE